MSKLDLVPGISAYKEHFRLPFTPNERALAGPAIHWPELDLLRSLAAALMVLNHVAVNGVKISGSGLISASAFAGSFAPVIFFFLTGLGYGVQSVGRPIPHGHGYVLKVLVLLAADVMLWVTPGTHFGLDFLGFIGLSMLLLEWVRRVPRSGLVASALAVLTLACRFLLGPLLRGWIDARGLGWLNFVLGSTGVTGVSYPLGPWLAYPLLGYVLGRVAAWRQNSAVVRGPTVLALLAGFASVTAWAAWTLTARGAELFRWGTMSFAYFLSSLAALAGALALVLGVARARPLGPLVKWVALSGVRSFAVVPLHYALLTLCNQTLGPVVGTWTFVRNVLVVLVLSFVGSALVPRVAAALHTPRQRMLAWVVIPSAFACAYVLLAAVQLGMGCDQSVRAVTQLALCVLLVTTRPKVATSTSTPSLAKAATV